MKIIYELDDANPDETQKILAHAQASEMLMALECLDSELRNAVKYQGDEAAEKWRDRLRAILEEYAVRLT